MRDRLADACLAFPLELRRIVYTTNGIESLNARFRNAVRWRGRFPNEQAALKSVASPRDSDNTSARTRRAKPPAGRAY